jgi:hypothetical protein
MIKTVLLGLPVRGRPAAPGRAAVRKRLEGLTLRQGPAGREGLQR